MKTSIEWKKTDLKTRMAKVVQNKVFDAVTAFLQKQCKLPNLPKDNHYRVILIEGTQQECDKAREEIYNINIGVVNNFLHSVRRSRVYTIIPKALRRKFDTINYNPDTTPFEHLQQKLMLLGVSLLITQHE